MKRTRLALVSLALVSTAGCGAPLDASSAAVTASVNTKLVLDLVNYPATDEPLLDGIVGLDARAAKGIVAARNGADGVCPSADDVYFTNLAQLDAIAYVGASALDKLSVYATAHPAPTAQTVEGVTFAGWQAEAAVWGANNADQATLATLLESRAVTGVIAARPLTTLAQIGAVKYVGKASLQHLETEAATWWTTMHTPNCVATFDNAVGPHLPDLLFLSESDRPFDLVAFPGAGTVAPTAASLLALVKAAAGSTTETRDPSNFYIDFEPASATADPNAAADVEAAIAAQLTDVVYIAVIPPAGSVDQSLVDVYLVGRTRCGDLVGLHAISVET